MFKTQVDASENKGKWDEDGTRLSMHLCSSLVAGLVSVEGSEVIGAVPASISCPGLHSAYVQQPLIGGGVNATPDTASLPGAYDASGPTWDTARQPSRTVPIVVPSAA
ncbi:hypothetical protein CPB85DRAFT_1253080 [Mucidula mucida]|nr:hypothetical protein CPB85DRAFT_1253080 [Mucidula mucida]